MCAVCGDDHSPTIGYKCEDCNDGATAIVIITLIILALALLATIWYIASTLRAPTTSASGQNQGAYGYLGALRFLPLGHLRIPLVALQIITQFVAITGAQMPTSYARFLRWLDVVNLDPRWLVSAGCFVSLDYYDRLLAATLAPLCVMVILAGVHSFVR